MATKVSQTQHLGHNVVAWIEYEDDGPYLVMRCKLDWDNKTKTSTLKPLIASTGGPTQMTEPDIKGLLVQRNERINLIIYLPRPGKKRGR